MASNHLDNRHICCPQAKTRFTKIFQHLIIKMFRTVISFFKARPTFFRNIIPKRNLYYSKKKSLIVARNVTLGAGPVFHFFFNNLVGKDSMAFEKILTSHNKRSHDNINGVLETLSYTIIETSKHYRCLLRQQLDLIALGVDLSPEQKRELEYIKAEAYQLKKELDKYKEMVSIASNIANNVSDLSCLNGNGEIKDLISTRLCFLQNTVSIQYQLNEALESRLNMTEDDDD